MMRDLLKILPGFRSRTPWKKTLAGLVYFSLFISMLGGLGNFIFSFSLLIALLIIKVLGRKLKHKKALFKYSAYLAIIFVAFIAGTSIASSVDPKFSKTETSKKQVVKTETSKLINTQGGTSNESNTIIPKNQEVQPKEQVQPTKNESHQTKDSDNEDNRATPNNLIAGKVTRVIDGDTAVVTLASGKEEKVRFIGVDTPESTRKHEPYGEKASTFTKRQINGKKIYLELDVAERDRYGRLLAYIWVSPPTKMDDAEIRAKMFNAQLLLHGYAQVMTIQPNSKYADKFVVYQREARNANKGLWGIETSRSSSVN